MVVAVGEEADTGNIRDVLRECLRRHYLGVDIIGQLRPGEKTAVGDGVVDFLGEVFRHSVHHDVAAVLVYGADSLDVRVKVEHINELRHDHHGDGGRLKHGSLRDEVYFMDDLLAGAHPCKTVARGEDL